MPRIVFWLIALPSVVCAVCGAYHTLALVLATGSLVQMYDAGSRFDSERETCGLWFAMYSVFLNVLVSATFMYLAFVLLSYKSEV